MKPANVAFLALAGMVLSSVSVYSLTPPGGSARTGSLAAQVVSEQLPAVGAPVAQESSRFRDGQKVTLEGRLGHGRLLRNGGGETFLLLEVRGEGGDGTDTARPAAPVNLALVIDRSGSMAGARMANALRAATGAVDRLRDGDIVSVLAFDTEAAVAVPPTLIDPASRARINERIRGIAVGGDTCVSCGIQEGLAQLERHAGRVNKMILLSDGDANRGVRDLPGFRDLARGALARGVSVTTIGVDVSYNEKILSAIALESNGQHHFVESDASLARIFEAEAAAAATAIASNVEAAIDLAPGVELAQVFDRTSRRDGRRVTVSLGAVARGDVRTVLLKLRIPAGAEGEIPVARAELTYRDLIDDRNARCAGDLAVEITADPTRAAPLDAIVAGRLNRSETAATLNQANSLFEQGKHAEARRTLETRARALATVSAETAAAAPAERKGDVDKDFKTQLDDLNQASSGFDAPDPVAGAPAEMPQASRKGKAAVKQNAQQIFRSAL